MKFIGIFISNTFSNCQEFSSFFSWIYVSLYFGNSINIFLLRFPPFLVPFIASAAFDERGSLQNTRKWLCQGTGNEGRRKAVGGETEGAGQ